MSSGLFLMLFLLVGFVFNIFLARLLRFPALVRKTIFSFLMLLGASLLLQLLDSPFAANYLKQEEKIRYYLVFFILLIALHLFLKILGLILFDYFFSKKRISPPRLLKDLVLFVLYLIGILLIINFYLQIKITVFLASSAVLTIVIGLAVQDILGNIFSGMILNFEHILKQGNWIKIGDYLGEVVQLGWRSIVIRDLDSNLIIVPNQSASKTEIEVFGSQNKFYYLRLTVGLHYRHAPDLVVKTIGKVLEDYELVLKEPPFSVFLQEFDQSSIVYQLKFAISDFSNRNKISSEIRRRLWYAFQRAGLEIPFPIRTVYMQSGERPELSADEKIASLSKNPVLQALEYQKFKEIAEQAEEVIFGRNEIIIQEGEQGLSFFQILSGRVEVLKGNIHVAFLAAGDFFGEISVVSGEPANASVIACEETRLLKISATHFRQVVEMNRQLAEKLAEVITRRQMETEKYKDQQQQIKDKKAGSENKTHLLERIIKYFGLH